MRDKQDTKEVLTKILEGTSTRSELTSNKLDHARLNELRRKPLRGDLWRCITDLMRIEDTTLDVYDLGLSWSSRDHDDALTSAVEAALEDALTLSSFKAISAIVIPRGSDYYGPAAMVDMDEVIDSSADFELYYGRDVIARGVVYATSTVVGADAYEMGYAQIIVNYVDASLEMESRSGAMREQTKLPKDEAEIAAKMYGNGYRYAIQFVDTTTGKNFGDPLYFRSPSDVGPFMRDNPSLKQKWLINLDDVFRESVNKPKGKALREFELPELTDFQRAENAIRDMFLSRDYEGVVPNEDIQHILKSPRWAKMYGKENVLEAWKGIVEDEFVYREGDNWVWFMIEQSNATSVSPLSEARRPTSFGSADGRVSFTLEGEPSLFASDVVSQLQKWARSYDLDRIYVGCEGCVSFDVGAASVLIVVDEDGANMEVVDYMVTGEGPLEIDDEIEKLEGNVYPNNERGAEGLADDIVQSLDAARDAMLMSGDYDDYFESRKPLLSEQRIKNPYKADAVEKEIMKQMQTYDLEDLEFEDGRYELFVDTIISSNMSYPEQMKTGFDILGLPVPGEDDPGYDDWLDFAHEEIEENFDKFADELNKKSNLPGTIYFTWEDGSYLLAYGWTRDDHPEMWNEINLGWSLGTSDEYTIEANAMEDNMQLTPENWEKINDDIRMIEQNSVKWLKSMFGYARDEGHDPSGDLVGSVTVGKDDDGYEVAKTAIDTDEAFLTSSGSMPFDPYPGTSDLSKYIDVNLSFYPAGDWDDALAFFDLD